MITNSSEMNTVSQIMEKLRINGLDNEFHWQPQGFYVEEGVYYQPPELNIIKVYRFEGESNPGDSSVIYIIETNDGLRGYSLDSYGIYSDHDDEKGYDDFLRQIPMEEREEQLLFTL